VRTPLRTSPEKFRTDHPIPLAPMRENQCSPPLLDTPAAHPRPPTTLVCDDPTVGVLREQRTHSPFAGPGPRGPPRRTGWRPQLHKARGQRSAQGRGAAMMKPRGSPTLKCIAAGRVRMLACCSAGTSQGAPQGTSLVHPKAHLGWHPKAAGCGAPRQLRAHSKGRYGAHPRQHCGCTRKATSLGCSPLRYLEGRPALGLASLDSAVGVKERGESG